MEVKITTRHCSIPDSVRNHMDRLIDRLERYEARTTAVNVSFDAEHGVKSVDARVTVPGAPPLVAHAAGPTFRTALDRARRRIERQLRRNRQRRRRHRTAATRGTRSIEEPLSS